MQRTLLLLLVAVSYLLLAGGRPWSLGPIAVLAAIAAHCRERGLALDAAPGTRPAS